jgi:hypothetical protein
MEIHLFIIHINFGEVLKITLGLDLLILMRFMFKQHTLKMGKHELVYHGNHLQ